MFLEAVDCRRQHSDENLIKVPEEIIDYAGLSTVIGKGTIMALF